MARQHEESADVMTSAESHLSLTISKNVVFSLGKPKALFRVQVSRLWDNHYRVNIFVGMDAASARVAHSFFVVCDVNGTVVESSPEIIKQY